MGKQTFYDQWHRIAELRVGLRASISIRQQSYRCDIYYVYSEPIHSGFFRATPETHALIQQIKPNLMLHDIWRKFVELSPKTAPGQKDFFDLIMALYKANLVYVEGGVNESRVLDRALEKKKKPLPAKVSELLFFRIPLWDPEPFLKRSGPAIRAVYSRTAIAIVFAMFVWAVYEFVLASDRAFAQSKNILQMGNVLPLYIAMFFTHIMHELSHAALCKRYGGNVRTMGAMLLMFTPLPYADVSTSWAFRNKWHRAAVGAAGMYSDIFFCSVATVLWAYSPPGLLNEVSMNLMFVTAVYTAFFNANPLMRFDGYYILSDLVGIPNLHAAAKKQVDATFKTSVLGEAETHVDHVSGRRKSFLLSFFCVSTVYRIIIMVGIVKFVADQYFGLGLAVAIALMYSTFVLPIKKFLQPLGNPSFMAKHKRKTLGIGGLFVCLGVAIALLPLSYAQKLDGVVNSKDRSRIFAPVNGQITHLGIEHGGWVESGQLLLRMENRELELELQSMDARLSGVRTRLGQSVSSGSVTLAAVEQELEAMLATRNHMQSELDKMVVVSPHSGIWIAPQLHAHVGQWQSKGLELGVILQPGSYEFEAVLRQEDASEVAAMQAQDVSIKIEGRRAETLTVPDISIIPFSQKELPSAAVSPLAGGNVALDLQNTQTPQAVERFFVIVAQIDSGAGNGAILDGRRGWLRVQLPPRSLGKRVYDKLSQFFQKRYKL
jgi:putative peptide zinc metalloprotease protein